MNRIDSLAQLESAMMEEAVKFSYRKKDGTEREAVGTLNRALMVKADGTTWEPVGEAKPKNPNRFDYWDLAAQAWRCFNPASFIGGLA